MGDVVRIDRAKFGVVLNRLGEAHHDHTEDQLRSMSYGAALDWAGTDFDKLLALAKARRYRPQWIAYQLQQLTPGQHRILRAMEATAGPYLTQRQRWVVCRLQEEPLTETELVAMADRAREYEDNRYPDRCIRNDLGKLEQLGMIELRDGVAHLARSSA